MSNTKVVTGKVRFSYVSIKEPRAVDGGDAKYSITLLIPKTDNVTMGKIRAAVQEAAIAFRKKHGEASLPAKPIDPVHDGDGTKPNSGEPYGPECKGCWVISASADEDHRPKAFDYAGNDILDLSEVYSGCYGRAIINFYGYNNRKKGVGCGLLAVQKLQDGDPLGGVAFSAADFDDGYVDPDADDFLK